MPQVVRFLKHLVWAPPNGVFMINYYLLCYLLINIAFTTTLQAEDVIIGDFTNSNISGWEARIFKDKTSYEFSEILGAISLRAQSQNSASSLVKKTKIDLTKYPYLNWSWRSESMMDIRNEMTKAGDDYVARLYVIFKVGVLPWRVKAVNYVWASHMRKYDVWESAFAGKNAIMVALRDKNDSLSIWQYEKRNVYEDLQKHFRTKITFIDAVAIMTDTDNNGGVAEAYYGDIFFSSQ